jgi:hypothetical protein
MPGRIRHDLPLEPVFGWNSEWTKHAKQPQQVYQKELTHSLWWGTTIILKPRLISWESLGLSTASSKWISRKYHRPMEIPMISIPDCHHSTQHLCDLQLLLNSMECSALITSMVLVDCEPVLGRRFRITCHHCQLSCVFFLSEPMLRHFFWRSAVGPACKA